MINNQAWEITKTKHKSSELKQSHQTSISNKTQREQPRYQHRGIGGGAATFSTNHKPLTTKSSNADTGRGKGAKHQTLGLGTGPESTNSSSLLARLVYLSWSRELPGCQDTDNLRAPHKTKVIIERKSSQSAPRAERTHREMGEHKNGREEGRPRARWRKAPQSTSQR